MLKSTLLGSKTHSGCMSRTPGEGAPTLVRSMSGTRQVPVLPAWPMVAAASGEVL